jgi:LuxR family transcriptional regulator, maltose regulon positive regulatory protein
VKRETGVEDPTGGIGVGRRADSSRRHLEPGFERFTVPSLPEGLLQRSRLLERLDVGVDGPLTLVSAPAGSGKSVLVSAWASGAQARCPVAWVTLEANEQSRSGFWSTLARGLGGCGVVVRLPSRRTDSSGAGGGYVDTIVLALLKRAQPVVVVLDCQAPISAEVARDLDCVLHRSGDRLRLVVMTRADPVLPLHRYRLAGTVVEIRMADLAFTVEEARELLQQAGVTLSDNGLRAIVGRTQGWAAGLRFAAVYLRKHDDQERAAMDFSGDTGDVAEYLLAEVLDGQSAGGRRLLLETSIVDVLRPGLSEAVAGPRAHRDLAVLARGNAFLSEVADYPNCFRYQPLFLEFLRAQLAYELPERVPGLHRAVAAWMAERGVVEEAVRHSADAGDWAGAAGYLIDDLAIGRLLLPGGEALVSVLARLPDDTQGVAAPLVRAALAMAVFDVEACEEHLLLAEGRLDGARTPHWSAAGLALQTVRLTHAAAMADVDGGLDAAAAAEKLLQVQQRQRLAAHPELSALIASSKGAALLATGRLDEAAEAFSAGARVADHPGCEHSLINCLGHLALLAAIRGQLRKTGDLASRIAALQMEAQIDPAGCPSATVAMAWVNTEMYDLPAARRNARQAAESSAVAHDPTLRVMLALVDARVRRARGDVVGALASVGAAQWEVPPPPQWLQDVLGIEEADLTIVHGRPALAVKMVEALSDPGGPDAALVFARARMATGEAFESPASTLRSASASLPTRVGDGLLEATRQLDAGDELRASQALERSLRLAAAERLRRPFREASPQVRRLLREDPRLATENNWLGSATFDNVHAVPPHRPSTESGQRPSKKAPSPLREPLTDKELEVLGHLAELLTTDEVAGVMFVSVNTVRTHVRNILRKLDASRRNEAIRRALELGIIAGWTTVEPTGDSRPA